MAFVASWILKKWQLPKLSVIPVLKSTKERSNETQVSHDALRFLIVLADIVETIIVSTKKINGWTLLDFELMDSAKPALWDQCFGELLYQIYDTEKNSHCDCRGNTQKMSKGAIKKHTQGINC